MACGRRPIKGWRMLREQDRLARPGQAGGPLASPDESRCKQIVTTFVNDLLETQGRLMLGRRRRRRWGYQRSQRRTSCRLQATSTWPVWCFDQPRHVGSRRCHRDRQVDFFSLRHYHINAWPHWPINIHTHTLASSRADSFEGASEDQVTASRMVS